MGPTLLTGGVGVIGSAVCAQVWREGAADSWTLLVRAGNEDAARARIHDALQAFLPDADARAAARSFGVIVGDLASLPGRADACLAEQARILHLAASTSFTGNASVWSANFDGAMALGAAARRMKRLQRLLYVGTAFRCGAAPSMVSLAEAEPPPSNAPHIVQYTKSKAAAEAALRRGFPELPMTVALPSIVAGHSSLGCQASGSIFWYFRTLDAMALAPAGPETWIDVVPVDWVAQALLHLLRAPSLDHDMYHVSAGETSRTSLATLAARFGSLHHGSGAPWGAFDVATEWSLAQRAFHRAFPDKDLTTRTMLSGVRTYSRFVAQGLTFRNDRLLATGIPPPPPLASYMAACLENPGSSIRQMFLDDRGVFTARP